MKSDLLVGGTFSSNLLVSRLVLNGLVTFLDRYYDEPDTGDMS